MSKALYILDYALDTEHNRFNKSGTISVEAETYDEACEIALKRLPKEKPPHKEWNASYAREFKHLFKLVDCLDQQHATYMPNTQEINVDNSSYSSSTAYSRSSLL